MIDAELPLPGTSRALAVLPLPDPVVREGMEPVLARHPVLVAHGPWGVQKLYDGRWLAETYGPRAAALCRAIEEAQAEGAYREVVQLRREGALPAAAEALLIEVEAELAAAMSACGRVPQRAVARLLAVLLCARISLLLD